MRVLFVDDSYPGHFRHLPGYLAGLGHDVAFAQQSLKAPVPDGVRAITFPLTRGPMRVTHTYLQNSSARYSVGCRWRAVARELRAGGYQPDVIMAFSGWGPPFFVKDVWPDVPLVRLQRPLVLAPRQRLRVLPRSRPTVDRACRLILRNAANMWDLCAADRVMVTTRFQLSTFPTVLWPKISVIHDGIDTEIFSPLPKARIAVSASVIST